MAILRIAVGLVCWFVAMWFWTPTTGFCYYGASSADSALLFNLFALPDCGSMTLLPWVLTLLVTILSTVLRMCDEEHKLSIKSQVIHSIYHECMVLSVMYVIIHISRLNFESRQQPSVSACANRHLGL